MASYFIDRPVFAWVIAIIIMLTGGLALSQLPVAQYPDIAPTTINVSAIYPGASAKVVEDSVTQVIEQQLTGLDGLDYVSSTSSSSGSATITLTFESGTDPDIAQVQVQNKLALATPRLPEPVQRQGVVVNKSNSGFLVLTAIFSPDGTFDQADIGDYIRTNLYDPISRIEGVGEVQQFGSQYAMRVWLDPIKLQKFNLVPSDIASAIRAQNTQVSSGELGGAPSVAGQEINVTITLQSLLSSTEEFRQLLIRSTSEGGAVRLEDVARVEIGAESYAFRGQFNGAPASGFAVSLAAGGNALDTASAVKEKISELSKNFPSDLSYAYPVDATPFIEKSIDEVKKTLFEAIILVFIVILVFLQSVRAAVIPMIAVPVVLLGTFAVLYVFGFTLNTLTLFAMVLAIGLLVDDAIVVVENVERVMKEEGLGPLEATRKSMGQITGALVGIAVVLSAVFIPMAFFPGAAGVIYKQFSVTIVSAMILSVIVAMVLTPALCATLLKPQSGGGHDLVKAPAKLFNSGMQGLTNVYANVVSRMIRRKWIFMVVFGVICVLVGQSFMRMPSSFLPQEDQGRLITLVQLPTNASVGRTEDVLAKVREFYLNDEKNSVEGVFTLAGFSYAGAGSNNGIAFTVLKNWSERTDETQDVSEISGRAMGVFGKFTDARVFAVVPPPIRELGNSNGFDMYLQDSGGLGRAALRDARNQLLGMAAQNSNVVGVRPNGLEDGPQFNIKLNYQKAQTLGVSISDATNLISVAYGGAYVNDFNDRGRIKRVYIQGDTKYRMQPEDLGFWKVRNSSGGMTPIDEITSSEWTFGPSQLQRYNGLAALNVQGAAAPGKSSGAALDAMGQLAGQLPAGVDFEWTGLSRQETQTGNQAMLLYVISILFVFLCLAALYESWIVPIAVILVAPLGIAGALLASNLRGLPNDVFFQVGLLTTVGLASKNAILIIEFAKTLEAQGMELVEATIQAVRRRLRPVLMTSFAFGFGVMPLATSTGAGAAGRVAIGTAVLGGLIGATVLALLFAPMFYVVVRRLSDFLARKPKSKSKPKGRVS